MSVKIQFLGRLGNNFCQYVTARRFAERLGLQLETKWPREDIVEAHNPIKGEVIAESECNARRVITDITNNFEGPDLIVDTDWCSKEILEDDLSQRPVLFRGYFADGRLFGDRPEIKKYFRLPEVQEINGLCLHFRLGDYADYRGGCILDPSWFRDVVERVRTEHPDIKEIQIVTEEDDPEYIDHFLDLGARVFCGPVYESWHTIRQFRYVAAGNSSFSYWAGMLGHAREIYVREGWTGGSSRTKLDQHPDVVTMPGRFWPNRTSFRMAWEEAEKIPGWFNVDEGRMLFKSVRDAGGRCAVIGEHLGRVSTLLNCTGRTIDVIEPCELGPVPGSNMGAMITEDHRERLAGVLQNLDRVVWMSDIEPSIRYRSVFIDGIHIDGQPLKDFKRIAPCLEPGAIVAFHDHGSTFPDVDGAVELLTADNTLRRLESTGTLIILQKTDVPAATVTSRPTNTRRFRTPPEEVHTAEYRGEYKVHNLTLLTMGKGRLKHLRQTMPEMLRQRCPIVYIDYECPEDSGQWCLDQAQEMFGFPIHGEWPTKRCGPLTVYRFTDRPEFFMPEIINKGFELAETEWVFILGCDMIVTPDFAQNVMSVARSRHFIDFNTGRKSAVGHYGAMGVERSVFYEAGRYDEDMKGYGYADTDFKIRMHELGVHALKIPMEWAMHIPHNREDRLRFYSDIGNKSWARNFEISERKKEERRVQRAREEGL